MARLTLETAEYGRAAAILDAGRTAAARESRIIGHHTSLHRRGDSIAVRYWNTDIVEMAPDGWTMIDTGGWDTVTTWARVNGLLPGPFAIYSRNGRRTLYFRGHPALPYADGLMIRSAAEPDGPAVGWITANGVETLLSADDLAAIVTAGEAAAAVRAERRVARLLREHPAVGQPRRHRGYDARAYDCPRCDIERAQERAERRATLAAEHAAMDAATNRATDTEPWTDAEYAASGSHYQPVDRAEWPIGPDGRTDYHAEPRRWTEPRFACPWDCPSRTGY